jgi:hypothetical protein
MKKKGNKPQKKKTISERFQSFVSTKPTATGCLEWTGFRSERGYGGFSICIGGKKLFRLAHRYALSLALGRELESDEISIHGCDNPSCVLVADGHVRLGTSSDNAIDREDKGRRRPPTGPYKCGLSPEDVSIIRNLAKSGVSQRSIAESFGRQEITISKIVRGLTYNKPKPRKAPQPLSAAKAMPLQQAA